MTREEVWNFIASHYGLREANKVKQEFGYANFRIVLDKAEMRIFGGHDKSIIATVRFDEIKALERQGAEGLKINDICIF